MDVFEVCDVTDDECYYTIGIYSTLDLALKTLNEDRPIETYNDIGYSDVIEFNVRKRTLDTFSEHGTVVATVSWERQPIEDDDEEDRWVRTVQVKEDYLTNYPE